MLMVELSAVNKYLQKGGFWYYLLQSRVLKKKEEWDPCKGLNIGQMCVLLLLSSLC